MNLHQKGDPHMGQPSQSKDEQKKNQYRTIYESIFDTPRVYVKDITSRLHVNPRTTSKRMHEAFSLGYVAGPHLRKRSYANMKEYVYFANCNNSFETYLHYSKNMNVVYHAKLVGFANTWIVSNKKLDIDGDIIVKGPRSDYYVPFTPSHSWSESMVLMQKKVDAFNPEEYEPERIIKTHWDETVPWDQEDETLFREFKYDSRGALTPIMKKSLISGQKIYEFMEKLQQCCTVITFYFPEGISVYDPYLFVFETDYEDFIINMFSELPTSPFFFRVSNKLFMYAFVKSDLLRCGGLAMANIGQLRIPLLTRNLLKKGIIKREDHAVVEYHWSKEL
jgi:hypothetical protein